MELLSVVHMQDPSIPFLLFAIIDHQGEVRRDLIEEQIMAPGQQI